MSRVRTILVAVATLSAGLCSAEMNPENLRCEYLADPLGVDATSPRLSWIVAASRRGARQTAYQVQVASSPKLLGDDRGDLWDSGRVASTKARKSPIRAGH